MAFTKVSPKLLGLLGRSKSGMNERDPLRKKSGPVACRPAHTFPSRSPHRAISRSSARLWGSLGMVPVTDKNPLFAVESKQSVAHGGKPKGLILVLNRCEDSA